MPMEVSQLALDEESSHLAAADLGQPLNLVPAGGLPRPVFSRPCVLPIKVAAVGQPFPEGGQQALIECMVLIYDNSNPIMGSLLSVARTAAEFNYGQARVPRHRGLRLPASTLSSCLREFGGSAESMWHGGGGLAGPVVAAS